MTITIVNNGTDPATNIVVDYFYLSGFSFVSGTSLVTYPAPPNDTADPSDNGSRLRWTLTQDINPGETVTLTFDLITNCAAQSGTHSVTVTYDPGAMTTSDTVYLTVNHGALVVTKTPSVTNAFVGDTVTWTLTVRSTGFGPASNIEITDVLGSGLTFISSTLPGGGLSYNHPVLATGSSLSYTVTARIDSCINLENTLNVSWGCGGGVYCQEDLSSSASINLTVREPALEFLSITPSPIVFNFCQTATVTLQIRNNGTGPAISPHIVPTFPAGYQIVNSTVPVTWDGTRWSLPTIAAGATVTYSFDLTTSNYCTLNNGLILFDADCTNECSNLFTAPQIEIASMNVLSDFPSLSVTKSAPNEIDVGQTINYAVTVSYNGNPSYSGDVTIVDTLPANIIPINITGGGVYNSGAGTITWTIPAASVINGVILNATFDGPTTETFPEICNYCFNTMTNTITASTQVTCPLTPTLHCDLNATASASTRINCRETGGTATVTGSKEAAYNNTENCTTIPYTLTFTFGIGITDTWSTISLQEMMNNGQTPSGNATFTVGVISVTRPVPVDGNWGMLNFLDAAGAPGPAGQTLVVTYSLYQPNTGSYYNDAVLTVPTLGGGICGTGNQQVLVTELVAVDASAGAISVNVPTFLDQCETITVTLNISKGTYHLYNPVVRFISSDYTYVPGSATWSGDGVTFPGGSIEPSISGSTLTWNNTQWGLPYLDSGSNQYYAFQNGGTITFQAVKSSSCSNLPDADADLYFDDNCERLGRNGSPSTNLKSSSSDSPIVLSKGNILIRKFPELVTATSDTVSFTVTIVNTGDGTSYNTVITDILGADMLFDPAYTGAASINPDTVDGVPYNPTITGRTLIFNLGDLAPNDVVLITIPARIVGCNEAQMFNRAEGSWGCGGSPSDCQVLPVSRQVNVNLQDSNLLIRGSGDVNLCEQNTLQLDVLNSGRTMDYAVQAVFIIPTGLNYVAGSTLINGSITGEPVQVGNELTWAFNSYAAGLGDLDPDEMITLTFDVRTDCDLSNSVSFQSYGRYIAPCDNYVGNISNTVTYTLEINDNRANLQVTKAPASQTGELNDSITWTITIRNTGLGTGYNLEFYDALPVGVTVPALPGYGISNQALNSVPQIVFDDGLPVTNLGAVGAPRTLIDIPSGGIITFDVTARVDSCSALTSQNQANVRWGCNNGCRFSYIPGAADLTTSPVIALINHQLASESICGAVFSFEVQNTGSRAVSVNLVDTLPAGFVYAAGTATIASDYAPPRGDLVAEPAGAGTGTITWDATNIPLVYPGETITITFEARNNVAAGNCAAPINGTNTISMTYNNSCGDSFGPVNSSITIDLNLPNFTIDVQPDTQIVPPGTAVCWNIVLSNAAGGDIVDSVDVEITFGPDYSAASIIAGNGSDGTVPVIAGNTVTYSNISVNENSNWTANVCGTAITNPDVSQLWVSATATGECSSGCFFGTASDTSSSAVGQIVKTVGPATATIGEEVTYTITVDYDGGSSNYQNVVITDTLPANISFVSQISYSGPNAPVTPSCAAGVCTWNVGNFTSSATGEQSIFVFTARVDNVAANQNGNTRTNTARATYVVNGFNYDASDTVDFTIIEPELVLAKTRTSAATGDAGNTVSYRLQTNHLGSSTATAYDVVIQDTVPSDMTYVAGSQASAPAADSFTQVGQVLTWTYNSLPSGTTSVITFNVTVNNTVEPAQIITNPAQTTWTSLAADSDPNERNGSGGVNDYISSSSVNFTIISPTIDKILTGAATHTIGSTVPYQITVFMIEGRVDNFRVRELMPDYLTIDTSSIVITPAWANTQTITGPNNGTANSYITWDFGTVNNPAPGQNLVITFNLIVADVAANDDGETFTNRGRILYNNYYNTAVTTTDNAQVITIRVPALVTNKTITAVNGGAPTATVGPGDIITYQYTVRNAGTGVANSVNITDTFPNSYLEFVAGSARLNAAPIADPTGLPGPNLNFNLSQTINGGATITLTFNARVLSTVSSGTVINNIAYAAGLDAINNPIPVNNTDHVAGDTDLDDLDNESITAVVPGLVVDKSVIRINGGAPGTFVQPGDTVTYQVTIQNVGGANALTVDLTDVLPSADFTYVNNSTTLDGGPAANPAIAGNTLTWDLNLTINGGNPTGSTRTITFDALVGSGIHQATVYTNTASAVNGVDGNSTAIPTASTDPQDNDLDDTDTADLTGAEPALVTDKVVFQVNGGAPSGTPPFVSVGDVVTFRYTVTNVGMGTAYNLDLTDILPSGFTYQAGSTNVTWSTGSYTTDPAIAGVNLSWNSSAQLAGSQVLTLQFNATVQNSAFIPIPPSGQFENIASATADDGAGTPVPTDNSADVPADTDLDDTDNAFMQPADPALVVDKSVVSVNGDPLRTFTEPGDTVRYRVTIQNVGGAPALSVDLQDTIDTATTYVAATTNSSWNGAFSGSHISNPSIAGSVLTWDSSVILGGNGTVLSPGATVTYDFSVHVTSSVAQGGTILNTGYGSGVDGAGTPIPANNSASVPADTDLDDTDSVTLPTYKPGLVTDKTVQAVNGAPSAGFIEPGDVITYQYTIQNVGQAVAYNVDITDTLPSSDFTYVGGSSTLDAAPIADPVIAGSNLTWNTNSTIAGGNPTGATITLRFNVTVGSGIHQGTVYTNTNWAVNGTDGDGGAIALASGDAEDIDLDDSDSVNLTASEPALVTDKIVFQVNGGAPSGTPPFVSVSDVVTFRYTVTNVGTGTAYNLDLTDILPSGFTYQAGSTNVTWPSGSYTANPTIAGVNLSWNSSAQLAGSQVLTLQFNATVQNSAFIPIPPSGQFENIASATADDGAGTPVPTDNSADVSADTDLDDTDNAFMQPADPALVVDKSVVSVNGDPLRTFTEPGDTVRYRVTIQNVGGAPALSVDLQDTIDAATTYIAGTTNASWNGAFSGSHTSNPSIAGSVLTWDSSVILGGNGTVLSPGATVTYDFNVHVTSSVTQGGTILNTGYGSGVDGAGTPIPANNSASVPADTDLDDTDSVTLPTYKPGLVTDKTVQAVNGAPSTGFIEPGDVITYQYTIQNVGQAVAYNVDITDTLPSSDFTYVGGSSTLDAAPIADPVVAGSNLTWNTNSTIAGGNPTGATITLRFNVTVGSGIHQGTVYTNTNWAVNGTDGDGGAIALASGDAEDIDLDDSDSVDLAGREPALVTDKVVSLVNGAVPSSFPPIVAPGDLVTFQYTVTNVGDGTAYNVDLTDILPNGYTYQAGSTSITWPLGSYTADPAIAGVNLSWDSSAQLAGGQALTLTFITLVTNDAYRPLPSGNWINTSSAFGDDGAGTPILADNSTDVPADIDLDDTDTADLVPAQPALVTDKEVVSVNGVIGAINVQPGDYIRYRYTITNVGRGIAFNVDTDDTLDIGLSYNTALIPPTTTAATWTGNFTGSHTGDPAVTGTPVIGMSLLWDSSTILGTTDGIILTSSAVLTMEYDIYVTTYIVEGTPVNNSAHAAAIDGRGIAVPANNSAAVIADTDLDDRDGTVLFTEEPALIVTKQASLTTVRPGDVVTFTVTVQNVGLGDALELYLTDQLPACFSYVPGSTHVTWPSDPTDTVLSPWNMNPSIAGDRLTFNIGAKLDGGDPTGETLTLTFNALVGTGCPTKVTNNVLARGVDGDSNPIILGGIDPDDTDWDDADSVDLNVLVPELSLQKSIALINGSAPGTTIQPGDTITYEIVIRNTGLAPLMRLIITDVKPSSEFEYISGSSLYNGSSISDPAISGLQLRYEIIRILNAGETSTLRLSFKATAVSDGMVYTNCADVVGYDAAGGEINTDESCVNITGYVPPSDGDISKLRCDVQTSGINNRLCAGDIASYCVTLYNNDTLSIHDPHLTFILPVGIEIVPGTFVLDGKVIPDPSITAGTVDVTLSTVLPKTTSVVCFQMIATANAKLGRIDFEFVVTDRTGKSTTCAIANIITVDDCQETNCGGIEKLNYPIRECNRLVAIVKPEFDTAYAMYAAGSFYRFAASAAVINNASDQTITADYNDLWKFRLFDIAEKNLDAITMRGGLSAFVRINDKERLQVIYQGAAPYFDRDEHGEATFWSSEIDDSINTASIGLTLFAQAERIFALKEKTNFLVESSSQAGLIEETENQMREKIHLLDVLINQTLTPAAPTLKSIPETAVIKIVNGKTEFVTVAAGDRIIETSAAILLGVSRYLQWENSNSLSAPEMIEAKANASSTASKIGALAFAHITISVDDAINSLKPSGSQGSANVDKDQDSSFDLRALTLASEALAEWARTDAASASEANAAIKKIGNFVANLQNPDGSFYIGDISSDFKNQITAIRILSDCQKAVSGTDYNNHILKGYSFIENTLWIDKFGLYRSGNTGGVFSYNPFDLAVYIQNYLKDGLRLKTLGKIALDSRLHRFLDTILNNGGMQLDDGWRQNEHLLVSSFSTIPKTAVFSVPMGKHLMSVLNAKIEFVDPVAQVPESLIEMDGKNLIKLESLNCSASYAAPSQRQFVTDIGNFALSELYGASLNFSSYTYPTYLMNKLPNTAWMLARKMGEYALYNSFTLDYSSKSGLDLRFSEKLMKEIPGDSAAAEIKLRKLLSQLAVSAGENFDFNALNAFKPLFVLFGTALPGVDRSMSEQLIINPKLLGYSEDRRIFLSDVGLNLARQANEYRFIEQSKAEIKYVLPILKAQISASLEFLNKHFMKGIGEEGILPSYIYPEINSSGEPLNYISSTEKTDLFAMLSILEGATAAMDSKEKSVSTEAKGIADKLVGYIIENFYDKILGRFKNSESDADLSTVNLYYLNKLGLKASSWLNPVDRKKFTDDAAALLKNRILEGSTGVKISVDGKPGKVSSIVDINTVIAASFSAMRMALDIHKASNNPEWLNIAKKLWEAQLDEGFDSTLKIFKGLRTSDEKLQEQVIYRYNSFDIGMVIGAVNEIMPYLEDDSRINAFEGLRVFFDKIVEGAEVQYLPFKERDRFHTGEFDLLPGLRTEVTIKYDDDVILPKGVYPGETVKFILKLQNRCAPSIASTSEYDFIDITDILPPRFTYIKGTTYINGIKGPEPNGDDTLSWQLSGKGSEGIILLTFLASVDTDATEGDYINYAKMAYVPAGFGTAYVAPSGWAQSLVKILKASALRLKFFEDVNANGTRDEGEIEHLIPSITLTLDSLTSFSSTRRGTFEPLLVKPGYHSLYLPTINPDTYWWLSGNNPIQFHSRIEEDTVLEVPLTYRRIVEGYTFEDLNGNGVCEKDSEGLENIELETSYGLTIISGEKGYFYYISQSPNETVAIKYGQRFAPGKDARVEMK
jgi:uncharacterized repeat protein (TIGR01451 family)/fimbrial isopeptide formation D2 family protein